VISKALLDALVCPKSKERLIYFPRGEADRDEAKGFLLAPGSRLRYRIVQGFPCMLPEEAEALSEAEVSALVARARELGLSVPA
jgi:uncharacterized protein YbaR (Trm112 family)